MNVVLILILSVLLVGRHKESLKTSKLGSSAGASDRPAAWPRALDEAVTRILAGMMPEDKATIKATKKEDLIMYHHGWGTGIRNAFGLWHGNRELMESCHADQPDGASMVIIEAVWARLQKE